MASLFPTSSLNLLKIQTPPSEVASLASLYASSTGMLSEGPSQMYGPPPGQMQITIPTFLAMPIAQMIQLLVQGETLHVVTEDALLTTQQAATVTVICGFGNAQAVPTSIPASAIATASPRIGRNWRGIIQPTAGINRCASASMGRTG